MDSLQSGGKGVLRVIVPRGDDPPYALDDNKIYVRSEAETGLAVRDEIVRLAAGRGERQASAEDEPAAKPGRDGRGKQQPKRGRGGKPQPSGEQPAAAARAEVPLKPESAPRTGVEVVAVERRNNMDYYIVRDLRNGMVVNNVTVKSARKLWHYAITEYAALPKDEGVLKAEWRGDFGLLKHYTQHKQTRNDFVQRVDGSLRFYFGVTEDGIHGDWRQFVAEEPVTENGDGLPAAESSENSTLG
jgi:hypothetical protein